jgi:hypothetical protein
MRRVPKNHPATPLLHIGNATPNHNFTIWIKVAGLERGADTECGALLGRGMRRYQNLEAHAGQGGTPGTCR